MGNVVRDNIKVWQRSGSDEQIRELSHWLGYGRWKDEERWRRLGFNVRETYKKHCRTIGRKPGADRVAEWGSGGGAIAVEMSTGASAYAGIDVSPQNLGECGRQLERAGFGGFIPVHIEDDPWRAAAELEDSIDLMLSVAVFQHFPSKEYGAEVLRVMHRCMREGAMGQIQMRFDNGVAKFAPKTSDYNKNFVYFTSYRIDEYWDLLTSVGFRVDMVCNVLTNVNYATFCFRK